ncbi:unnamed protein product [Protopolystoma xenopodis]|uniref:Uncharacterized protein n=1 Tax=Protopolystoma xenopodis TaxID=117903 RepID=A0A448XR49_9PLAT|nr:unnamed protein product [Protopolystoma xenopodis]
MYGLSWFVWCNPPSYRQNLRPACQFGPSSSAFPYRDLHLSGLFFFPFFWHAQKPSRTNDRREWEILAQNMWVGFTTVIPGLIDLQP